MCEMYKGQYQQNASLFVWKSDVMILKKWLCEIQFGPSEIFTENARSVFVVRKTITNWHQHE